MSGSGGGGGGGGGFEPPSSPCADLSFETQLSSPRADVVRHLREGDVLNLETRVAGGTTVVVALHGNEVAGGLASPWVQRLRECIEAGTAFSARVLAVNSGQVRVRVEAVT